MRKKSASPQDVRDKPTSSVKILQSASVRNVAAADPQVLWSIYSPQVSARARKRRELFMVYSARSAAIVVQTHECPQ